MLRNVDLRYLLTPTGLINLIEVVMLVGALISVAFTSHLYAELADNVQFVYSDFSTMTFRGIFQSFIFLAIILTILIIAFHLVCLRYAANKFPRLNKISMIVNIIMALLMISLGICAALWEDKLRRTPQVIKRGYFSNKYQTIFNEMTHPRPGAAAAAATFAFLAGILYIIEACTRPMLAATVQQWTDERKQQTTYAVMNNRNNENFERIIPIETVGQTKY